MKKFVALLLKKKQAGMNRKNDDSDFLPALYSVHKKITTIFFYTLLAIHRSVASHKYF